MIAQDAIDHAKRTDLLALVGGNLRKVATTGGGEYAGPCPMCGGRDRFRVQPVSGRWLCRHCTEGKWQDAIDYVRRRDGVTFSEAVETLAGGLAQGRAQQQGGRPPAPASKPTEAPNVTWQAQARAFVETCEAALWADSARAVRRGLATRGIDEQTAKDARLGWNDIERRYPGATWGVDHKRTVWLPRGLVIPWEVGGELWRVNIRRPRADITHGKKYIGPAGFANALYNADALAAGGVAVLVEGELDALTIAQHAGDLAAPVATGSTHGARRGKWAARLALASTVLVAFDADEPGEDAAAYWLGVLTNAYRLRPFWSDANQMAQDGADLRQWLAVGIGAALGYPTLEGLETATGSAYADLGASSGNSEALQRYERLDSLWAAALGL